MSFKEIKCPHCKQWTLWAGNHHDRCLYCNGFLDSERFTREVEQKIKGEVRVESDPLFIYPTDSKRTRKIKTILRSIRTWLSWIQIAFFVFISTLLFIAGMISA